MSGIYYRVVIQNVENDIAYVESVIDEPKECVSHISITKDKDKAFWTHDESFANEIAEILRPVEALHKVSVVQFIIQQPQQGNFLI